MRMWSTPVKMMCNQHLLGEHVEMHMFVGSINKGISIKGYVDKGLVDTSKIRDRHNELAFEMIMRGIGHNSDLPFFKIEDMGKVNVEENINILINRCTKCKELYFKLLKNSDKNTHMINHNNI